MEENVVVIDGKRPRRRSRWLVAGGLAAMALVLACATLRPAAGATEIQSAFKGDSSELKESVVVPTLDTPMPKGKNVIWCSSFQMAWNHLKDDVIKEPVRLRDAEAVSHRLNASKQSETDLPEGSYYATAGWVKEGILETIRSEMAKRFPNKKPSLSGAADIVAYAYLATDVKFTEPFFVTPPIPFNAGSGGRTAVPCFGTRGYKSEPERRARKQIDLLYVSDRPGEPAEFIIDPCKTTSPNQLILARVAPGKTLAETLQYVEAKLRLPVSSKDKEFGPDWVFLAPNIFWNVTHRFGELEKRHLLNARFTDYWIEQAVQQTEFKLDRTGAKLKSEARIIVLGRSMPRRFEFNQPFLIIMKKRGAEQAFFVMWVDNAELLCKP